MNATVSSSIIKVTRRAVILLQTLVVQLIGSRKERTAGSTPETVMTVLKLPTISLGSKPIFRHKNHILPTDNSTIKIYEFN